MKTLNRTQLKLIAICAMVCDHIAWGFYVFVMYAAMVCVVYFAVCVGGIARAKGIERKRLICTAGIVICPWLSNIIRGTGITNGHEMPCVSIIAAVILVSIALINIVNIILDFIILVCGFIFFLLFLIRKLSKENTQGMQ